MYTVGGAAIYPRSQIKSITCKQNIQISQCTLQLLRHHKQNIQISQCTLQLLRHRKQNIQISQCTLQLLRHRKQNIQISQCTLQLLRHHKSLGFSSVCEFENRCNKTFLLSSKYVFSKQQTISKIRITLKGTFCTFLQRV